MELKARIPEGALKQKWSSCKAGLKLVSPTNRRRYHIIVVGSGLAGASVAAALAEMGYQVSCLCYQDSTRRAHSIAAQGGINAAKNYPNDGDSVWRLFLDTLKGGDFRSREANVYRLAELSNGIIDQCVAQGVPFAREYGGLLGNRSFGGAQVSRTFYARGQTGQQLLLGAIGQLNAQVGLGRARIYTRHEMLELVLVEGRARGIIARDLVRGRLLRLVGDCVVLCTGGYSNVFYLSTNAQACNVTAGFRAYRQGAGFANPAYTQIHPTCIPVWGKHQSKLTLMSESLRNDGRVWVPKTQGLSEKVRQGILKPRDIDLNNRDYYLERKYPSFGNLTPRDIACRGAKEVCDQGRGITPSGLGVFLEFKDAVKSLGTKLIAERYGNLFDMYERITDENPYEQPMKIYPAAHYTMGGLWVDYHLQSNIEGLFVAGEANFSDHGANRLGASALMQGLADGYFILPATISHYLGEQGLAKAGNVHVGHTAFNRAEKEVRKRLNKLLNVQGKESPRSFHKHLGRLLWDYCGMAREKQGLQKAMELIEELKANFWKNLKVAGTASTFNQELERAGRVADFLEFGSLMCQDALMREESCGGHFRVEHQYGPDHPQVRSGLLLPGEARRNDAEFAFVGVWEHQKERPASLHKEPLLSQEVPFSTRSYR